MGKKIIGRLQDYGLTSTFQRALYHKNFEMEQDNLSKEDRIYPIPRLRLQGFYPYCAVLQNDGLEFSYSNIPEIKTHHKTIENIFKEVLKLRKNMKPLKKKA